MELRYSALLLERRDPAQGGPLKRWLGDRMLPGFAARTLPLTSEIALACGEGSMFRIYAVSATPGSTRRLSFMD
jgi:hypothetical protein